MMKSSSIAALFVLTTTLFCHAGDQQPESKPEPEKKPNNWLNQIVVTAKRLPEYSFESPYMVDVVKMNDFKNQRLYRNSTEALKNVPGIMVQKTGYGQGSPYIRGLTGYHTVLMIDGIRLNNSIWRSGPNQYFNLIDPWTVDRYEVVKGPASVLYGSDAVGGAVNAITKSREKWLDGFNWDRTVYYRVSTAEASNAGRLELGGNYGKVLGITTGGTVRCFGDLDGGGGVGRMKNTGYSEYAGDVKIEYFFDPDRKLTFAHYSLIKDDAWRTHKTTSGFSWHGTTVGSEDKRVLDEKHYLTYLKYDEKNMGAFIDEMSFTFSWQRQIEDRHRVRWGRSRPTDDQYTRVDTLGLGIQFVTPSDIGRWTYGLDWYHDKVRSWKKEYAPGGALARVRIQGPVGDDGRYDLLGLYVQNEIPLGDRTELTLGGRFTHAEADINDVEDPNTGNDISLKGHWDSAVGSARISHFLDEDEHWNLFAGVSQGFRAPNFSDLSRLDEARSNEIETPSPGLDPEKFITYEIGMKTQYKNFSAGASWFYTDIDDMIIRAATGRVISGSDEVTKLNAGRGYVNGVELNASWIFVPDWTAFGSFAWNYGAMTQFPTSGPRTSWEPLSRLMPPTGQFGVRWDHPDKKFWVETRCTVAGHSDHLPTRDARDTDRIPHGGTPGYFTMDLRGGWRPTDGLELWAGLENITNEAYRIVGSGINEPGINFTFGMKWNF